MKSIQYTHLREALSSQSEYIGIHSVETHFRRLLILLAQARQITDSVLVGFVIRSFEDVLQEIGARL